jgi:proline iminopeptidase
MHRRIVLAAVITMAVNTAAVAQTTQPASQLRDYYPPIEPFKTGYLKVSDLHEIYYELCGNPAGIPVIVLHGGPGSGCYPSLRRYHDPAKYLIVLHDQRGSGRSKPKNELRENDTQNLVEDIEKLRTHLKLERVQLFGGSWGSTLALAYAQAYPQNVSSMVLRGVFTATKWEIDHFYHGPVAEYFPMVYERMQSALPNPEKKNYPKQFLAMLQSEDPQVRDRAARAWGGYESRIAAVGRTDADVENSLKSWDPYGFSLIENYYMAHNCFLKEGELLGGGYKLADVPTIIVQGRYDVICPADQRLSPAPVDTGLEADHRGRRGPQRRRGAHARGVD